MGLDVGSAQVRVTWARVSEDADVHVADATQGNRLCVCVL